MPDQRSRNLLYLLFNFNQLEKNRIYKQKNILLYLNVNFGLEGDVGDELLSLDFERDRRRNGDDSADMPRLWMLLRANCM